MIRTVYGTGCGVYSDQHMERPVSNLEGGSQISVTEGQRIKVASRYAVTFRDGFEGVPLYFGVSGAIYWVYEDQLIM